MIKIKPILDHLNEKFANLHTPSEEISPDDDESMLVWKAKLGFVQEISDKVAGMGTNTQELFKHLFHVSIVNAWIVFKTAEPNQTHRDFRTILVENIMSKYVNVEIPTDILI